MTLLSRLEVVNINYVSEESWIYITFLVVLQDIGGNDMSLSEYSGKVLLIVNVASKCGLTHSNYKELNVLYEKYKNQGFEILAFPCNQFAGQEPGSNEEIKDTVCTIFKAEFPIFDKIDVNGKNAAPVYKFLKSEKGGYFGDAIKWNFTKFLVNKEGKVVERYAPTTSPLKIEVSLSFPISTSESKDFFCKLQLTFLYSNLQKDIENLLGSS
uniref:Glutathione peroxidase n=1 Tax=Salix viminalis TaxID=40686 RepID=A0A6N2MM26_SALVM